MYTPAFATDPVDLGSLDDPIGIGCALVDPVGLRVTWGLYAHEGSEPVYTLFEEEVTAPSLDDTVITVGPTDDADFDAVVLALQNGPDAGLSFGVQVEMVPPDLPPGSGCIGGGSGPGLAIPLPAGATVEWFELTLPPYSFVKTGEGFTSVAPPSAMLHLAAWGTAAPVGPPVADAGEDFEVSVCAPAELDGSASWSPAGPIQQYYWTLRSRPEDSVAELHAAYSATPWFAADWPGVYDVELVVGDGFDYSAPDRIRVTATNEPPIANAGQNSVVDVGDYVWLDGTASADPDGHPLEYAWLLWARPFGSYAALDDPDSPTPMFLADWPGDYVFRLEVSDGWADSEPAFVQVTAVNGAPIAVVGADSTTLVGKTAYVSGTESYDPDGQVLSWRGTLAARPAGSEATLSSSTAREVSFGVDQPGDYGVRLVVTDPFGASDSAEVVIHAPTASAILSELRAKVTAAPEADFARGKRATLLARLKEIADQYGKRNDADIAKARDVLHHLAGCSSVEGTAASQDWVIVCDTQLELRALVEGFIATAEAER